MTDSTRYPDGRLPVGKSVIRILRIHREEGSSVAWKLERVSLDSQDCPDFITTSYVWGEDKPENRVNIEVNGGKIPVAPSVLPILELFRDHPDFKKAQGIWI